MKFKDLKVEENTDQNLNNIVKDFIEFTSRHIGLKQTPRIKLIKDPDLASMRRSFGGYEPGGRIEINVGNRHIMDVLRTLAHEMVHFKQDMNGELTALSGKDGSPQENEANAKAAVVMRLWGKMNPELFKATALLAESMTKKMIHDLADRKGIPWDDEPSFLKLTKRLTGKEHLDDLNSDQLQKVYNHIQKLKEDQLNELNIAQTLKFIKQAHGDQLYGSLPYWRHPRAVALTGRKIFGSRFTSDAVKTAFLHDVVEDTHIGIDELSKLDFSPQVIDAVSLLTKNKSLTYRQNIEAIIASGNPLAMMVKYADNYENYTGDKSSWDPQRATSSQKKYLMSLNMLGTKLGVKHHL